MRRWILYILAFFSGLLSLGTLIVWPVSHFQWLHLEYKQPSGTSCTISSHTGRVQYSYAMSEASAWPVGLSFNAYPLDAPERWSYLDWNAASSPRLNRTNILGVMWLHDPIARPYYLVDLTIPCAYLAILFSMLPAFAIGSMRRHRRSSRKGLCARCSYDLRAHRPGENCPECGTPIPARDQKT